MPVEISSSRSVGMLKKLATTSMLMFCRYALLSAGTEMYIPSSP